MNTFDVGLAGYFATEAGHVYGEIRDKVVPYFENELANANALYATQKDCLERLKSFRDRLDATGVALKGLVHDFQGRIGNQPFLEVLGKGVEFAKSSLDVDSAISRFTESVAHSKRMAKHD